MNEPTLYRTTDGHMHHTDSSDKCKHPGCEAVLIYGVPVEPCEHGNYARHIIASSLEVYESYTYTDIDKEWCPGAVIGGSDE